MMSAALPQSVIVFKLRQTEELKTRWGLPIQRIFERSLPRFCDPEAGRLDIATAYRQHLAAGCREPIPDQVGQYIDAETVGEQCPAGAAP
jgi:hypothetical protein